ncbi:lipase chaperone LimK [Rhodanobacter sp. ANJX3]|uniref:lipase secretion chaperone n=1 Tax=unclassified Rhodanobacter TaxID=2621553 RepID=UPI0015C86D28|nr:MULTISPECIES: lipase secretion chaperone [unclassified Rhodanobacter]MBB5360391.1 lipase chaperone LimK [Rhodanobacter sp. ANJX3]NYE28120.1 lipase chaperone LimK [Rhodanobacter sp. K2T2]
MSTLALIGATALVRYGIAHMGPAETPVTPSPAATIADTLQASSRESAPPLFAAQRRDPHDVLANGSLRGTEPDGGVSVGFGGHLKPDMALRRLFDYYLVLLGETDLSSIRTLLHDDLLRRRLDPPLIDEVMASFDRYTHYQQAAVALANQPGLSMEQQLTQVTALRRQMLGDETAEAFYGDEQRRQQQSLQRLAIQSDTSLSPAEKARRLQALDAALPAAEQEAQAQVSLGTTVQEQTEAFDAAQTDADTRHAERAQLFGDAAADRLQQLDQSRAQWQARLDAYTQQSQAIQADSTLTSAQQQAALQQLLTSSFHGGEQVQVQAMQSSGLLGKSN